jgi:tartrate dehydratase beta subunit/fumarate hydratase class I family protein
MWVLNMEPWNMRIFVNQGKEETVFTKPVVPTGAVQTWAAVKEAAKDMEVVSVGPVNSVQMAEYKKAELNIYHKDSQEYQSDKEKVFVVILGQCTKAVKSTLANSGGLDK